MVRLRMEQEVVRANAFTESLINVASQVFGGDQNADGNVTELHSIEDMESSIKEMLRGT
jgi:hypothetical protein